MNEANVESERSERIQILGRVYRLGSIYRIQFLEKTVLKQPTGKAMTGIGFWCVTLHGERSAERWSHNVAMVP